MLHHTTNGQEGLITIINRYYSFNNFLKQSQTALVPYPLYSITWTK